MTKRTWFFTFVTTLLILGLAACSGGGGGGGSGGGGIPSATNSAITPPPATAVAITATGGTTSSTNQSIGAHALEASDGASGAALAAGGLGELAGVQADGGAQARRQTLAEIVRRHAERLKDHQSALTGALQVITEPCSVGGTMTLAFDDANNSATVVWVNCNEGGMVTHGTIRSSNVSVVPFLGSTVGSTYNINVTAAFTIDLKIATTVPAETFVTQSSFNFTTTFNGNMVADGAGGVQPGPPNDVVVAMGGTSLLVSDGTVRELLSNFSLSVDKNDLLGRTTISGGYTYASTIIGGSVTVTIPSSLVFQPQDASHPGSGAIQITSPASLGKIVVTVISSPVVGVSVDAYANAAGPITESVNLTWAQVEAL